MMRIHYHIDPDLLDDTTWSERWQELIYLLPKKEEKKPTRKKR